MTESEILDKLADGLAYGEYSLLLGAGATADAEGGSGRLLPTGTGLRDALITDFNVDAEGESVSLALVYDHVRRTQPKDLSSYLHNWFTKCRPTWQHMLAKFNWHRIWTLNIDDVIESAFNAESRPFSSFAWNDRFSDYRPDQLQQIIHLHGSAERFAKDEDLEQVLVFSILEYTRAVTASQTWHKVFFDEFVDRPCLVIGARLTEEIDLAEVLNHGTAAGATTGYPSVVVLRSVTQLQRSQLEAAGLVIVESEAEGFVRNLLDRYQTVIRGLEEVYGAATQEVSKFMQQFIDLRRYDPIPIRSQDFYSGYEPTWETIQSDSDAILGVTEQAAKDIIDVTKNDQLHQVVHLVTGDPGGGKSASILRIANELIGAGVRPYFFRADEAIDVDATIKWLRLVPKSVLVFDDCADFASDIQELASRCASQKVTFDAIIADRSAKLRLIRDRISSDYLRPEQPYRCGRLSDYDVDQIINKLHSRGRLGKITRFSKENQRSYFVKSANRQLFAAMAELEEGLGFKARVQRIYENLPSDSLRTLYAAACITYEQAIPLPTGIGAEISNLAPRFLVKTLEEEFTGVLVLTRSGIRPPHRMTAAIVVNDVLSRTIRYDVTLAIAKALAPHIDQRSMAADKREYRIVRLLMDQAAVIRYVGEHDSRSWYRELLGYYDWNSRYWDQRALLESRLNDHETARSFAERSIQVRPHPFGYNTLGTVLLRMAIQSGRDDPLLEGIKNLETARDFPRWGGTREHPFVTFFNSLIRFAESWGIHAIPQQARNSWAEWFRQARSAAVFNSPESRQQLEEWQRTWLGFAVESDAGSSDRQ